MTSGPKRSSIAYDEDRWVALAFKVNATPTYVLLAAQGSTALAIEGEASCRTLNCRNCYQEWSVKVDVFD